MNQKLPAILGGEQAVTLDQTAANRWPILTKEDESAVCSVLRDGDISLHPVTRALEDDYRKYLNTRHALAHCNGTAALLAAFFSIDPDPGDEIIVPSATFWASVVPMLWLGAVPVFAESEMQRLGPDPEDVESKITPRTRAIVVTHLWGMPCKMTELLDVARRNHLVVIEDASHALGATWRNRLCGTIGDIGVFSLQGGKLAPAGEGGILVTDNDEYMERATCLGDIVRTWDLESPAKRFAGTSFGIKTRMAPLSAAVARIQLKHLDERNTRRNENLAYLSHQLAPLGFETFLPQDHINRVYFEYLIQCPPQQMHIPIERLVMALRAEGCEVAFPRYPLIHQQPLFTEGHWRRIARLDHLPGWLPRTYRPDDLPRTTAANDTMIRLPSFPNATRPLLDQYAGAFQKVVAHADQIMEADFN